MSATQACPFPLRATWAVYKVGTLWRVMAPVRVIAAHPADAWGGDFATHAEALAWATDVKVREVWMGGLVARSFSESDRILWLEGMLPRCTLLRHQLFDGQKAAA